ncbi:MAG: hypothetical protein JWR72_3141 [Flavisolibacter sp.]|nr:hypothetical protein [Flavisolibacter sp.]
MSMRTHLLLCVATIFIHISSFGQESIYTKEGRAILNRMQLITNCLKSLNKNRADKTALAVCQCQVQKIDRQFTNKQYKKHTKANVIDINGLMEDDSLVAQNIRACFTNSGQTVLLQAEGFEEDFLSNCRKSIESSSEKSLDVNRIKNFCRCQLQLVKARKLTDAEMSTLSNPNSVLFYEIMYKCGSPFVDKEETQRNWTPYAEADVRGAVSDTIDILTLNGMTYVKIKIGSMIQVWLLDTGASDLLIGTELESALKKENIINESNYLGTGEYELANGMIDTCRRYKVNNVQIGDFIIDNVLLAVTEKGKRIIVGKALLNKFRKWSLNNEENKLVLSKQ